MLVFSVVQGTATGHLSGKMPAARYADVGRMSGINANTGLDHEPTVNPPLLIFT
ncbi:MAG: hypothetical protein VB876_18950 [Pirellulales bacterium]